MKKLVFLAVLVLCSCSKEDDNCKQYSLVTESNEKHAYYKCDGLANAYPQFEVISTVPIGCLTKEELIKARKTTTSVTQNVCAGVTSTVRTLIR